MTKKRPGAISSRETFGERMRRHGHTAGYTTTPTYRAWAGMLSRCNNPNASHYADYGGRGITVCDEWRVFENFLRDNGERPSSKHSLDRFPDRNGNYEPGNVRWATMSEQCRNRRTTRAVIRDDGLRFNSIIEAAETTGGNRKCIFDVCSGRQHLHHGHSWRYE